MLTSNQRAEYLKLAKQKIRVWEEGHYSRRNEFEQSLLDDLTLDPKVQQAYQAVQKAEWQSKEAVAALAKVGFETNYKGELEAARGSQANQEFRTRMAEYDAEVGAKRLHHESALLALVNADSAQRAEEVVRSL